MSNITGFNQKVYYLTKQVPKGKVTTYKSIARAMKTKAYQAVGQALKNNPHPPFIPCHRVVKSNGTIGGFAGQTKGKNIKKKINLLKKEGIKFQGQKIKDFNSCQIHFIPIYKRPRVN